MPHLLLSLKSLGVPKPNFENTVQCVFCVCMCMFVVRTGGATGAKLVAVEQLHAAVLEAWHSSVRLSESQFVGGD